MNGATDAMELPAVDSPPQTAPLTDIVRAVADFDKQRPDSANAANADFSPSSGGTTRWVAGKPYKVVGSVPETQVPALRTVGVLSDEEIDPTVIVEHDPEWAYNLFKKQHAEDKITPADIVFGPTKFGIGFTKGLVSGLPSFAKAGFHAVQDVAALANGQADQASEDLKTKAANELAGGAAIGLRSGADLARGAERNASAFANLLTGGLLGSRDKNMSKDDVISLLKSQAATRELAQAVQKGDMKKVAQYAGLPDQIADRVFTPEELKAKGYSGERAIELGMVENPINFVPFGEFVPKGVAGAMLRGSGDAMRYSGSILDNPFMRWSTHYSPIYAGSAAAMGHYRPAIAFGLSKAVPAAGRALKAGGDLLAESGATPEESTMLSQLRTLGGAPESTLRSGVKSAIQGGALGATQMAPFALGAENPEQAGEMVGFGAGAGMAGMGVREAFKNGAFLLNGGKPLNLSGQSRIYGVPDDQLHAQATAGMSKERVEQINKERHGMQAFGRAFVLPEDVFDERNPGKIGAAYVVDQAGDIPSVYYRGENGFLQAKAHEGTHLLTGALTPEMKAEVYDGLQKKNDPSAYATKYYSQLYGEPVRVDFDSLPDKVPNPKDKYGLTKDGVMEEMLADMLSGGKSFSDITQNPDIIRAFQLGAGKLADRIGIPLSDKDISGIRGVNPSYKAIEAIELAMRGAAKDAAREGATYGQPLPDPETYFKDLRNGLRGMGYQGGEATTLAESVIEEAKDQNKLVNLDNLFRRAVTGKWPEPATAKRQPQATTTTPPAAAAPVPAPPKPPTPAGAAVQVSAGPPRVEDFAAANPPEKYSVAATEEKPISAPVQPSEARKKAQMAIRYDKGLLLRKDGEDAGMLLPAKGGGYKIVNPFVDPPIESLFSTVDQALDATEAQGFEIDPDSLGDYTPASATPGRNAGVSGKTPLPEGAPAQESPASISLAAAQETTKDSFGSEVTPVAAHVINDIGGIVSKSAARAQGRAANEALWNDAPNLRANSPTHNKIYNPKGEMPDVAAQSLYDHGLIPEPSVQEMWRALEQESGTARTIFKQSRGKPKFMPGGDEVLLPNGLTKEENDRYESIKANPEPTTEEADEFSALNNKIVSTMERDSEFRAKNPDLTDFTKEHPVRKYMPADISQLSKTEDLLKGKPDKVVKQVPHNNESAHAYEVAKYGAAGLTGELLRQKLESGRAADLRRQKGEAPAGTATAAEDTELPRQFMPAEKEKREPSDKITSQAVRVSGITFPGKTWKAAKEAAAEFGFDPEDIAKAERGYVTKKGPFLTQDEASQKGVDVRQFPEGTEDLPLRAKTFKGPDRKFMPAASDAHDNLRKAVEDFTGDESKMIPFDKETLEERKANMMRYVTPSNAVTYARSLVAHGQMNPDAASDLIKAAQQYRDSGKDILGPAEDQRINPQTKKIIPERYYATRDGSIIDRLTGKSVSAVYEGEDAGDTLEDWNRDNQPLPLSWERPHPDANIPESLRRNEDGSFSLVMTDRTTRGNFPTQEAAEAAMEEPPSDVPELPTTERAALEDKKFMPLSSEEKKTIQGVLDDYDNGENGIDTVEDIAGKLAEIENPEIQKAVQAYQSQKEEDFREWGGRGDADQYEKEFFDALDRALGSGAKFMPRGSSKSPTPAKALPKRKTRQAPIVERKKRPKKSKKEPAQREKQFSKRYSAFSEIP